MNMVFEGEPLGNNNAKLGPVTLFRALACSISLSSLEGAALHTPGKARAQCRSKSLVVGQFSFIPPIQEDPEMTIDLGSS
ncbi:hypothetical protein RSAG8_11156, partial [Rhizoctonia solani AG-8 WAC10335]